MTKTNGSVSLRPRVLLVAADVAARTGGIAMIGRSVMRLLADRSRQGECDYRVLSLRPADDAAEESKLRGWTGAAWRHFGDRRMAFARAVLWQMARWADVTVFMHLGLSSVLLFAPRAVRGPAMTFVYGLDVWEPLPHRKKAGLLRSDRVITISQYTVRRGLESNPWFPPARLCYLGIPSEIAESADLEGRLGFSPSPHDVVIVGRMARDEGQKGHRELIEAMEDVVAAVPDARLIVVGPGDNLEFYQGLASRTRAADRIVFAGFIPPGPMLWGLYRRAGVFAMPSRQEGFGLVYLEAMRAGLPCVASNCDAAQEVVVDGQTGYQVDPGDRQALAAALIRLLSDNELRTRMGAEGRRRFEQLFTEAHFHQRVWQEVEELVAGRRLESSR